MPTSAEPSKFTLFSTEMGNPLQPQVNVTAAPANRTDITVQRREVTVQTEVIGAPKVSVSLTDGIQVTVNVPKAPQVQANVSLNDRKVTAEVQPPPVVTVVVQFANRAPGSGPNFTSGSGVPSGSFGNVGDWYLDTDFRTLYQKTAAATWTDMGTLAKSVTNSEVTFQTPTAGEGIAQLSTL